jgi:hypothetical protein
MARFLWICAGGAAGTAAVTMEKVRIVKYAAGPRK